MIDWLWTEVYGASINQRRENMFGKAKKSKNKIELEEKVEALENKIANIMDVLEMQDDLKLKKIMGRYRRRR